jgi:hypothetical protein
VTVIWAVLSLALAVLVAALGELVSDEIRARLDRIPFAMLAAAARRLPAKQRADMHEQAWLPELHHILRGDQAMPITRLIHGTRFAAGLWLAAPRISRELKQSPERQVDVMADIDRHLDLLALKPVEFEHLIRQLIEAIGMKSWVTQASRDEGVDGVAYNDDPILGGLCVIQVNRYRRAIGLEAIQTLADIIEDTRAVKGIIVTTSRVSKATREVAARHRRIEIIDGCCLKSMIREYLGRDVLIRPPTSSDDEQSE